LLSANQVRALKQIGFTSACRLHDDEVAALVCLLRPGRRTRSKHEEGGV